MSLNVIGTDYIIINREILDQKIKGPCLIISNHSTAIDFLLILDIFKKPLGFPVKAEMFKIPIIK